MDVYTSFEIGFVNPTIERAEQLLLGWQEFILDAANIGDPIFERLTLEPWLRYDLGGPELSLACHFYGNDDLHADLIAHFLPKILNLLDGGNLSPVLVMPNSTYPMDGLIHCRARYNHSN